jgi:hypothetical protein
MSDNSFKTIRNNVIASVIGGIILLSVPVLRGYTITVFKWIWSLLIWCWKALLKSYALPGWAWLIIIGLALLGIIILIASLKNESDPEFKSYTEDMIRGAKWRWKWSGNRITDLWCYCPTCDATLVYDDSSCRRSLYEKAHTKFICENCGHNIVTEIEGGNKDYAVGAVEREVDRRIRTNEYKKH